MAAGELMSRVSNTGMLRLRAIFHAGSRRLRIGGSNSVSA